MDAPSSWLTRNADLLPRRGRALDVACGSGRHALWLAGAGLEVRAVDRDAARMAALAAEAHDLGLAVDARVMDLELGDADLGDGCFDVVVVVHYLHRPLFPALLRTLAPGGLLLYETFTVEHAKRGRPKNPDFLLKPGELNTLVQPLEILRAREGEFEGRMVASVAARKPAAP